MTWEPYVPPWYPIDELPVGRHHNPFSMNGQEGLGSGTKYGDWANRLPEGELVRRIRQHREEAHDHHP